MPGFTDEMRRKGQETRARKKAERDAKKAGREAAPTRRTPPISKKQVEHGITAVIVGVDAGLAYLTPQSWNTPEDRLTDQEVAILTEAFSTEAMKSSRALRFFAAFANLTGQLGVVGALMIVALPRLTRRGLIPRAWVPVIRDLLGAATAKDVTAPPEPTPEPAPVPDEPAPDRQAAA